MANVANVANSECQMANSEYHIVVPYETTADIRAAEQVQELLYDNFDSVQAATASWFSIEFVVQVQDGDDELVGEVADKVARLVPRRMEFFS